MVEVKINSKKYYLKTSFSELTDKEFLKIAFIRSKKMKEIKVSEYESLRITAFFILSNVPLKHIKEITASQFVDILPFVDFIFEDRSDLEKNPIKFIKKGLFGKKYYGPKGMLENCSIYELCEADTAFIEACNDEINDSIYKLAAILYRPKRKDLVEFAQSPNWNGDIREPYNQEQAIQRINDMKRIPFHKIIAIFIYYSIFRYNSLVSAPGFSKIFEGDPKVSGLNLGWLNTLFSVSNGKFGNFEETKVQAWDLVLISIANDMVYQENLARHLEEKRLFSELNAKK